jgi:hypothetical protein
LVFEEYEEYFLVDLKCWEFEFVVPRFLQEDQNLTISKVFDSTHSMTKLKGILYFVKDWMLDCLTFEQLFLFVLLASLLSLLKGILF